MKGCICHFTKWQIHPFISRGTRYNNMYTMWVIGQQLMLVPHRHHNTPNNVILITVSVDMLSHSSIHQSSVQGQNAVAETAYSTVSSYRKTATALLFAFAWWNMASTYHLYKTCVWNSQRLRDLSVCINYITDQLKRGFPNHCIFTKLLWNCSLHMQFLLFWLPDYRSDYCAIIP